MEVVEEGCEGGQKNKCNWATNVYILCLNSQNKNVIFTSYKGLVWCLLFHQVLHYRN